MIQYLQRLSLSKVYLHRERVSLVGTDLLSVRTEGVPLLCVGMDDLLQDTPLVLYFGYGNQGFLSLLSNAKRTAEFFLPKKSSEGSPPCTLALILRLWSVRYRIHES